MEKKVDEILTIKPSSIYKFSPNERKVIFISNFAVPINFEINTRYKRGVLSNKNFNMILPEGTSTVCLCKMWDYMWHADHRNKARCCYKLAREQGTISAAYKVEIILTVRPIPLQSMSRISSDNNFQTWSSPETCKNIGFVKKINANPQVVVLAVEKIAGRCISLEWLAVKQIAIGFPRRTEIKEKIYRLKGYSIPLKIDRFLLTTVQVFIGLSFKYMDLLEFSLESADICGILFPVKGHRLAMGYEDQLEEADLPAFMNLLDHHYENKTTFFLDLHPLLVSLREVMCQFNKRNQLIYNLKKKAGKIKIQGRNLTSSLIEESYLKQLVQLID